MKASIITLSVTELAQKIKHKELSVQEVLSSYLAQIDKFNPIVNAISDRRTKKDLMNEAREKDAQLAQNLAVGKLFGVPVTIKECFGVKGLITTNGDPNLKRNIAQEDAEMVRRFRDAGAIIIGMTNVPLFSIDWQSTNSWNGQTNNPFDLSRVAGGSSGGSSVAVASSFSPISLGADAGGSVRIPAHFCGICGLRPTENYLSNRGHVQAPNKPNGRRHVITPGPFTKNISDLRLAMEILGNNSKYQLPEFPPLDFNHSKWDEQPLKIAYSKSINNIEVDAEYLEIFNGFIDKIQGEAESITLDHPTYDEAKAYTECSKLIGYELGVNFPKMPLVSTFLYVFIRLKYKDHLWAKGMAIGPRMSNKAYAKTIDHKDQFATVFDDFLTKYDIWITPVCSFEAYKHQKAGKPFIVNGKKVGYTESMGGFTFTSGYSGHPIVTFPIGQKKNGMPVGVEVHSRKWTDNKLLEIAECFEKILGLKIAPNMEKLT